MRALYGLAFAAALVAPCLARAETTCAPPRGVTHLSYSAAPPSLSQSLAATFSSIAAEGQPFNASDIVQMNDGKPVPTVRVLFVWRRENRWVVGLEQGGRGYHTLARGFDIEPGGSATPVVDANAQPLGACAAAKALIGAV